MKKTLMFGAVLAVLVLGLRAVGGEGYLGTFTMDAGSGDNMAHITAPFTLPSGSKVSVQCSADVYICADRRTCTAAEGVLVPANTLFMTSTRNPQRVAGTNPGDGGCSVGPCTSLSDGGTTPITLATGVISAIPATLGTDTACKVFSRSGNETP